MRHSSVLIIAAISCVLFSVSAIQLSPRLSIAQAAQAQNAQLQTATATTSPTLKSADVRSLQPTSGTEIYTAKRGEAIPLMSAG